MSILDRLRGEVKAEPQPSTCQHTNRQDLRTMGARGAATNRWRCRDCGYSPVAAVPPPPRPDPADNPARSWRQ